jgi:hypothetical protein
MIKHALQEIMTRVLVKALPEGCRGLKDGADRDFNTMYPGSYPIRQRIHKVRN